MPGPPRKPTALRIAQGNRSRRPLPVNEPRPPAVISDDPPAHLSPGARRAWAYYAPILRQARVLTVADLKALSEMCECESTVESLRADVHKNGRNQIVITTVGEEVEKPRPVIAQLHAAERALKGWLQEFGLTPASRSKVSVPPPAPQEGEAVRLLQELEEEARAVPGTGYDRSTN
jgi:P27 family predicted phage terminase small subunit